MKKTLLSLIGEQDDGSVKSGLVLEVRAAIRKRICDLSRYEIALLVRHGIGLTYTVPITLDLLEDSLINVRENFMGELYEAVLSVRKEYWEEHPELNNRVVEINSDFRFFLNRTDYIASRLDDFTEIW